MTFVSRLPELKLSRCSKCIIYLGVLFSLLGSIMVCFWGTIVDNIMKQELTLLPGTKTFEKWVVTPVPMYVDIYLFNWTNPQHVKTQTPVFTEMGPYRFYQTRTKVGTVWNANKTLTFREKTEWFFDPDNSNGTLRDEITNVDVVTLTAAKVLNQNIMGNLLLTGAKIEKKTTVKDLMFNGYNDALLTLNSIFGAEGKDRPTKFGWFYARNGSASHSGVFNVATGEGDLSQRGKILRWNYNTSSGFYPGQCGRVTGGYTGELFAPGISRDDKLKLFGRDICRVIELNYSSDVNVKGLDGLSFSGEASSLCPCESCPSGTACPLRGLLNLTSCSSDSSLYMSYPHFLHGDPKLLEDVKGLSPDPEKHSFQMTVEPNLGMTIDLKGRFQLNLLLEPFGNIARYSDIPKAMYMPIMWFDQRATLTDDLALQVQVVLLLKIAGRIFFAGLCFVGILMVGITILRSCLGRTRRNKSASSSPKTKTFLEDMHVNSSTKLLG